jgi:hypothetical protein
MEFMMTEEVSGHWYYHISYTEIFTQPICGEKVLTMWTSIPIETCWGLVTHIGERYCKKCKEIYDERNENKNEGKLTK